MDRPQRIGRELTLYVVLFITAFAILSAMLFILRSGNQMIATIQPLADASMEIGIDASQAHLWMMEAALDPEHRHFDTAQYFLKRADRWVTAMLDGGTVRSTRLAPLDDPEMRERVQDIKQSIAHLLSIKQHDLPALLEEHLHGVTTHRHDALFTGLLDQTAAIEAQLREIITREHRYFRQVQITLITICVGFFVLVTLVLKKHLGARRRYEARIKRLNLVLRAVRNVNHLITREKDRSRLIKTTCELLVEDRGFLNAWITLVDERGKPTIQAEAGLGEDFAPGQQILQNGELLPCCTKISQGDGVFVVKDPHVDCPDCPLSEMYTGRSGLAVKLQHSAYLYGFMVVSSPRNYAFDTEEHSLFAELAEDIALSLHLLNVEEERVRAERARRESEDRYRTLAANIPNIDIYLFDRELRYLVAEGSEMRANGLTSSDYEGKTLCEAWDERMAAIFEPMYLKALEGESASCEYRCCDKHYALTAVPVYNGAKHVVGGIALTQNITERKQAEEAIKRSESILRHTFEAIPDLISVHDSNYNVVTSNWHQRKAAQKRYIDGRVKCYAAYQSNNEPCNPCHAKKVFATAKPLRLEKINAADGTIREVNIYPILSEDGEVSMVTEHVRDITEQRRAEKLQSTLLKISEATNLTPHLDELLRIIHQALGELIDTTNFYVALYDEARECYSFPYSVDEFDGTDFSPDQLKKSLTDYVRRTGKPLLADEVFHRKLEKAGEVKLVGQPSKIWLGVPLTTSHGVIGVVVVQSYTNSRLYGQGDKELLSLVSGHITMAVERKLAEEALRKSEERLRAMYEQASVGVALIGMDGRWQAVNERLCQILGYSRNELLNMRCQDVTHPEDTNDPACIIDQARTEPNAKCTCEKRYIRKDGNVVWVNVSAAVVSEPHDDEEYVVAVIQDVSERKAAESMVARYTEQLVEANRALEAKQAELEEFIYTVSHDLKAPIVSISGFAGLVREKLGGQIDATSEHQLDRILHNATVMEQLIGDLLELSRIGRADEPVTDIDMDKLTDDIFDSLSVTAASKKITLKKAGNIPAAFGRYQRIRQLLTNLVDNAIKYMPDNRTDAMVEVGFATPEGDSRDNGPAYYVRDNGNGIAPEFHERIFNMFQRATPPSEKCNGSGIGLAIVKRIVQKHNGRIWLSSKIGKGSTFYFTLYASQDSSDNEAQDKNEQPEMKVLGTE